MEPRPSSSTRGGGRILLLLGVACAVLGPILYFAQLRAIERTDTPWYAPALADTARTQERFPHLTVVSDAGQSLAGAAAVIGPHRSPTGEETVSPTTVLIGPAGRVRWVFRPDRYTTRLSPQELLAAIDEHL